MKRQHKLRIQALMLPGIKRWIAIMFLAVAVVVYGVLLLMGLHPLYHINEFISDLMHDATSVIHYRISGIIVIALGVLALLIAGTKAMQYVLNAYLTEDRESIPDVLYRKRHLQRGPRVVVIGGGTGLSNLLKGLKTFTNNITAIVTVGDDGGSSGRLRQELGVLPPGDIRNCITALADEEKLVTELFRYRFESGQGLEGHSFGNLFLSAVCAITHGDMLEAVKVASRVLNSCGQVLPSTLDNVVLVAEMEDGSITRGESKIPLASGKIKQLSIEPSSAKATPAALEAIASAELIVLGPGSLYTSIIPNLLVEGIASAIKSSAAHKLYVLNVMTQAGETLNYSASDHVEAVLKHGGAEGSVLASSLMHAVLANDQLPTAEVKPASGGELPMPVSYDPERVKMLGVPPEAHPLLTSSQGLHHDPEKLARVIMLWFYRKKNKRIDIHSNTANTTETKTRQPLERFASLL
jgi:uncharacterized cofD-like protein